MPGTELLMLDDSNIDSVARKVGESLGKGGICIIPTDTIYGIVALEGFQESIRKIYEIKKRPAHKPFIRLIGSMETLKFYTHQDLPEPLGMYWPGPLTVIFRGIRDEKVAVRFPDDQFLRRVFRLLAHRGIVAPSANISGEENIFGCGKLVSTFGDSVEIIVCAKDDLENRRASTIIDITGPEWRVVRQGAIKMEF